MILLDPDLAFHTPPRSISAVRRGVEDRPAKNHPDRMPSARTLEGFLREARAAVRLRGQVTVLLTTDPAIRRLNRQFRGKDKATDVLSFPAANPAANAVAGDLAISVPTAQRQALEQGHALSAEIKVLMLHGLLHLAGYDHEVDRGSMARREMILRKKLGLPVGLIERAGEMKRKLAQKLQAKRPIVAKTARVGART